MFTITAQELKTSGLSGVKKLLLIDVTHFVIPTLDKHVFFTNVGIYAL